MMYLTGRDAASVNAVFFEAPAADYGLKAYLFGYLFSRDIIDFVEREIVTASTLVALNNVNMQLKLHLGILKNLGVTGEQFERIFKIVSECVGEAKAQNAREVLKGL